MRKELLGMALAAALLWPVAAQAELTRVKLEVHGMD